MKMNRELNELIMQRDYYVATEDYSYAKDIDKKIKECRKAHFENYLDELKKEDDSKKKMLLSDHLQRIKKINDDFVINRDKLVSVFIVKKNRMKAEQLKKIRSFSAQNYSIVNHSNRIELIKLANAKKTLLKEGLIDDYERILKREKKEIQIMEENYEKEKVDKEKVKQKILNNMIKKANRDQKSVNMECRQQLNLMENLREKAIQIENNRYRRLEQKIDLDIKKRASEERFKYKKFLNKPIEITVPETQNIDELWYGQDSYKKKRNRNLSQETQRNKEFVI